MAFGKTLVAAVRKANRYHQKKTSKSVDWYQSPTTTPGGWPGSIGKRSVESCVMLCLVCNVSICLGKLFISASKVRVYLRCHDWQASPLKVVPSPARWDRGTQTHTLLDKVVTGQPLLVETIPERPRCTTTPYAQHYNTIEANLQNT